MFTGFYAAPYSRWADDSSLVLTFADLEQLQKAVPAAEKHWEFVAVALLHIRGYATAECALSPTDRETLGRLLTRCVSNHHAANWRLMRTLTQCALANKSGPSGFSCLTYDEALHGGLIVRPDGQLEDIPGDSSTQYHAYLLHLVMRFGDRTCPKLQGVVAKAMQWLVQMDREDGDPNARGRGRFQLFGYVSMAVCYSLATAWGFSADEAWGARVRQRISHNMFSGALPIYWDVPMRQELLLGYNTTDDYPAFARFWLGSASEAARYLSSAGDDFLHRLPGGSFLLTNAQQGALLGVTPRGAAQAGDGLKDAVGQCVRASRRLAIEAGRRLRLVAPETEPLPQRVSKVAQLQDWTCHVFDGNERRLKLTPKLNASQQSLSTVWVSPGLQLDMNNSVFEGSVEVERLTWWTHGRLWEGYNLRTVREARVLMSFKESK